MNKLTTGINMEHTMLRGGKQETERYISYDSIFTAIKHVILNNILFKNTYRVVKLKRNARKC